MIFFSIIDIYLFSAGKIRLKVLKITYIDSSKQENNSTNMSSNRQENTLYENRPIVAIDSNVPAGTSHTLDLCEDPDNPIYELINKAIQMGVDKETIIQSLLLKPNTPKNIEQSELPQRVNFGKKYTNA